jgi:zeta-carotene desaturase
VIGGGLAGLSTAAKLAAAGARVLVAEARPGLGGRASSFADPSTGEPVDNGQHLLLGCYHETFEFLDRVGAGGNVRLQASLDVTMVDAAGRETALRCPSLPPPYHLLAGILRWNAVGLRDRLSALRMVAPIRQAQRVALTGKGSFPASDADTVEQWLTRRGQARRLRLAHSGKLAAPSLPRPPDLVPAHALDLFAPRASISALPIHVRL